MVHDGQRLDGEIGGAVEQAAGGAERRGPARSRHRDRGGRGRQRERRHIGGEPTGFKRAGAARIAQADREQHESGGEQRGAAALARPDAVVAAERRHRHGQGDAARDEGLHD